MNNKSSVDFSTLLAVSIHDAKNILGSVLESMDWLVNDLKSLTTAQTEEFQKASRLVGHVNSELMQLLCFFKFENNQYALNQKEHNIEDFLDMQAGFLSSLIKKDSYQLNVNCDENLNYIFDEMLIATAIRNAGMNSIKFAKSIIQLSAEKQENFLCIKVEDDGPGYPEKMLGEINECVSGVDLQSGSTGLGLFFAETVVKLHKKNDASGRVVLAQSEQLGGASFQIFVP